MTATVADQVFARVSSLTGADPSMTRAEAIRAVSAEMGRSVPATSSAFYAGAKRAEPPAPVEAPRTRARPKRTAAAAHSVPALYAEMLPLVEAGATVEQAARRFGDEEGVAEIAEGFRSWRASEAPAAGRRPPRATAWRAWRRSRPRTACSGAS